MGDMGDIFNDLKAAKRALRSAYGLPCPECQTKQPKRNPTIMLPGQRCKVDGFKDKRPHLTLLQRNEAFEKAGLEIREVR